MRIQNLIAVLCLILAHSVGASALAVERPNIIFLFADDQRADTIGAHGNPHIQTPNLDRFAAEGFKWHNGKGTLDRSFTNGRSIYMGGMANHADFQVQDLTEGKLSPKRAAGGFSSTVFADEAVKFISNAGSDQPFFLYVAFMAPHDPRNPPEKYRQMYYRKRPPLPSNFLPQHPFQNAPQATSGRDESLAPWPRTKEVISDQL